MWFTCTFSKSPTTPKEVLHAFCYCLPAYLGLVLHAVTVSVRDTLSHVVYFIHILVRAALQPVVSTIAL